MAGLSKYFGGMTGKIVSGILALINCLCGNTWRAAKALSGHAERMEREQEKAAGANYGANTNGNSSRGNGQRKK